MISFREKLFLKGFRLHDIEFLEQLKDEKERERLISMGPNYLTFVYPNEIDRQKDRNTMDMLEFIKYLVVEEIPLFIKRFGKISDYDLAKKLILINPNIWFALDENLQKDKKLLLLCQPLGVLHISTKKTNESFNNLKYSVTYNGGFNEDNYPEILREDPILLQIYINIRSTLSTIGRIQNHSIKDYKSVNPGYDSSFKDRVNISKALKKHFCIKDEEEISIPEDIDFGSISYIKYDKSDLGEIIDRIDLSNPKTNMFDFR